MGALAAAESLLAPPSSPGDVIVREGFLAMDDVAELFAATDTVALPYRAASQSGVLLLAYGFKRPVIVYPVGGLVEAVVDGETGWICARADPEALARGAARERCRRPAGVCAPGRGRARLSEERYAWPVIARRTGELYTELL